MFDKKFGKDFLLVVSTNILKTLSSFVYMLAIPILFSVEGYGFYNLFLLYLSYVGIVHFGFIDGIYLKFGGKKYEDLDFNKFSSYTKFLFILELVMAFLISIYGVFQKGEIRIIFFMISINLILVNMTTYYQYLSQCLGRFKEFSIRTIILSILNVILVLVFYFLKIKEYHLFIIGIILINLVLFLWYVYSYRKITFNKSINNNFKSEIINIFKIGAPLLMSNIIILLLGTIPRQILVSMFPADKFPFFSYFSFAVSLLGFTSIFLTAVGLVIYPSLKKGEKQELINSYNKINMYMIVAIFFAITMYYPVEFIINKYIDKYNDAVLLFFILCPSIVLTSSITTIKHNYYKVLNYNKQFFIISSLNLIMLTLTIVGISNFIDKTNGYNFTVILAIVIVVMQFLWYLMLEVYLASKIKINGVKNIIYLILGCLIFYGMFFIPEINKFLKMIIYFCGLVLVTGVYYKKEIIKEIRFFKNMIMRGKK